MTKQPIACVAAELNLMWQVRVKRFIPVSFSHRSRSTTPKHWFGNRQVWRACMVEQHCTHADCCGRQPATRWSPLHPLILALLAYLLRASRRQPSCLMSCTAHATTVSMEQQCSKNAADERSPLQRIAAGLAGSLPCSLGSGAASCTAARRQEGAEQHRVDVVSAARSCKNAQRTHYTCHTLHSLLTS